MCRSGPMVVYNQFRLKNISKSKYSETDIKNLIKKHSSVYEESNDKIIATFSYRLNDYVKWDVYIIAKENSYEILMENTEAPRTTVGAVAVFGGRNLLKKIEKQLQ